MKLSRRGFIKAAPAAAVAAPAVAAKIVQDMGGMKLGGISPGAVAYYPSSSLNETKAAYVEGGTSWAEDEIKRLIRNRAETKAGFEALGDSIRYVEAQRIDGLRSVSPVSKARMAAEAERRRALAGELKWIDQRIADMKRDYPVLAYLTEAISG
jgi:hypothetical protein